MSRKRCLIFSLVIVLAAVSVTFILLMARHRAFTNEENEKVAAILERVIEKYPQVDEKELIDEVMSGDGTSAYILDKYGITEGELLLYGSNGGFRWMFCLVALTVCVSGLLLFAVFMCYDNGKNREIREIAEYVRQINRGNFAMKIDNNTENELSVLKNEVYKTTIKLKEVADASVKDKLLLKDALSDISHQLKTPITALCINLDNLDFIEEQLELGSIDAEKAAEMRSGFVLNARRDVRKISSMVQIILKFSRLDSGTVEFERGGHRICELVTQAVANVAELAELRDINVEVSCDGDDGETFMCDLMWQTEALTNIVKNAVEHAEKNVYVVYESGKPARRISVSNDGRGLDAKDMEHLFERFYRGENAVADSVGIGLAMAKTIVEKDRGMISVENREDGVRFVITY